MLCPKCGDDITLSSIRPLCERCDDQEQYAPGYWTANGRPELEKRQHPRLAGAKLMPLLGEVPPGSPPFATLIGWRATDSAGAALAIPSWYRPNDVVYLTVHHKNSQYDLRPHAVALDNLTAVATNGKAQFQLEDILQLQTLELLVDGVKWTLIDEDEMLF